MKETFNIEYFPLNPETRMLQMTPGWAIVWGDESGIMAVFRSQSMAENMYPAFRKYAVSNGVSSEPKIVRIKNMKET